MFKRIFGVLALALVALITLTGLAAARTHVRKSTKHVKISRVAAGAAGTRSAGKDGDSSGIGFGVPTIVDPVSTFGEPTIGVNPVSGEISASGPTGTGTQRSQWEGSFDGGATFRVISPLIPSAFSSTQAQPGGGDTDVNYDRSGKTYFSDLYALTCFRNATTTDGGATVYSAPDGCSSNVPSDREWFAVYDPAPGTPNRSAYTGARPLIYQEYNGVVDGTQWNKSTDGLTFTPAVADSLLPGSSTTGYAPFGADGYPAIDQVTGDVIQSAGGTAADGSPALLVNIGTPDAAGNLHFRDDPEHNNSQGLIVAAKGLAADPGTLFTVASEDSARNVYIVYTVNASSPADRQTFVVASPASSGWTKWTNPVQISDGKPATGDAATVFPWIKAGGPGRADAVFYGEDQQVNPSSQKHQNWNVFMSQLVFPLNDDGSVKLDGTPQTTLVKVSQHPMHTNDICLSGTGCIVSQGNRNLADFFSMTIDKNGAAEIMFPDTSNGVYQTGLTPNGNETVDHSGGPVVTVVKQTSGLSLYGKPLSGDTRAPVSGMASNFGDAKYPVIGGSNVNGMDLLGTSMKLDGGNLTITTKVLDASNPATTLTQIPGSTLLQYVARWQMGGTIYYAEATNNAANQPVFSGGKISSVDLCSVSACYPHIITYPEAGPNTNSETGKINCPATPSLDAPCTITVTVKAADVGNPTPKDLLESVGTYALAASQPQGAITNAQAQVDSIPLEIDGTCCFNYGSSKDAAPEAISTANINGGAATIDRKANPLALGAAFDSITPDSNPTGILW